MPPGANIVRVVLDPTGNFNAFVELITVLPEPFGLRITLFCDSVVAPIHALEIMLSTKSNFSTRTAPVPFAVNIKSWSSS